MFSINTKNIKHKSIKQKPKKNPSLQDKTVTFANKLEINMYLPNNMQTKLLSILTGIILNKCNVTNKVYDTLLCITTKALRKIYEKLKFLLQNKNNNKIRRESYKEVSRHN